ncbi:MAG: hypothetical protein OXI95_12780 [bacterium]|nr:hypothetical protein [bacterium]MDE0417791.1 hypothetical protein [bacterium]
MFDRLIEGRTLMDSGSEAFRVAFSSGGAIVACTWTESWRPGSNCQPTWN